MRRLFLVFACLLPSAVLAGDADKAAAKLRSPVGTLLQRGSVRGWTTPMLYDSVPAGAELVALPGARGILELKEGDLRLILAGGLPGLSKTPVLESAVTLHHPKDHELEFTLGRGRVVIENKEAAAARVRVRFRDKTLEFRLLEKNAIVALELLSRWPAGTPFLKKPKADHQPVSDLIFFLVKGRTEVTLRNETQTLQGPVLYRFTTLHGTEGPLALKKMPEWVKGGDDSEKGRTLENAVEKLRRALAEQGPAKALAQPSAEVALRQVIVASAPALDVPLLALTALNEDKAKEVRAAALQALTHYIGRGHAEDVRLYETLIQNKVKPGQAGIIMELLHGLGQEALLRPETYDALITYLQSDQLAIRELAASNLYQLVPQGRDIVYDAAAPVEQRAQAQAAWRKLIPEGQLPKTPN